MRGVTRQLTRFHSDGTQITPAVTTLVSPQVRACEFLLTFHLIASAPQVSPATPTDVAAPPAADPSSTPDPSANTLDLSGISLATGPPPLVAARTPVLVAAPTVASHPDPEAVLAPRSPTPAPVARNDSEDSPGVQNTIPLAQNATVPSDDPPARVIEPLALAVYSEPAAGPTTSALESTGNSDEQGDSQPVPSTSGASKRASRKAKTKKAPKAKKVTAK